MLKLFFLEHGPWPGKGHDQGSAKCCQNSGKRAVCSAWGRQGRGAGWDGLLEEAACYPALKAEEEISRGRGEGKGIPKKGV